MAMRTLAIASFGIIPAFLIGGCATVPPRYAYYQVPCTTPGAVLATPVAGAAGFPTAPGYPVASAAAAGSGASAVATCVIAVRNEEGYDNYGSPYYGRYGGHGPYGYGSLLYGSVGLGFGFSSHHHHLLAAAITRAGIATEVTHPPAVDSWLKKASAPSGCTKLQGRSSGPRGMPC